MQEIERTFLLTFIPEDIDSYSSKQMVDLYIPNDAKHPILRLRQNGNQYMITKKYPKVPGDLSVMTEETIELSIEEYNALMGSNGKLLQKMRYTKLFEGYSCEIDVFEADLQGHAVVDFEFDSEKIAKEFIPPAYCGIEITHIEGLAGGMIAGKTYEDIKKIIASHVN